MSAPVAPGARDDEASRWLLRAPAPAGASHRVYVFPHSGGSVGEYVRWSTRLPESEVYGVQPPGRGSRLGEAPLTNMPDLVGSILGTVDFRPPFLLYGHSLGALVAYEVAHALREAGAAQPFCLVTSACRPPHLASKASKGEPGRRLTDDELIDVVDGRYASIPSQLRDSARFRRMFLPCLRADFAVAESYAHTERPPLDCPVVVMGGEQDQVPREQLEAWRQHTTGAFDLHMLPGGHFFTRDRTDDVVQVLAGAARFVPGG